MTDETRDQSEDFRILIKQIRESYGLSQESFAKHLGITAHHLCHIETGRVYPSWRLFFHMIQRLGIKIDFKTSPLNADQIKASGNKKSYIKHGEGSVYRRSKEHTAWVSMRHRCNDPMAREYRLYGGRGIKVCERWMESFDNFLSDMGRAPGKMHSVDRKNVDGNYEPTNCRWATPKQQANNKRNTIRATYNGQTKSVVEWCEELGIVSRRIAYVRIKHMNWDPALAISTPVKKKMKQLESLRNERA